MKTAIIAGTAHEGARSFTAASQKAYEATRAYRDQSVSWIIPTRGWYPCEVVGSWDMIQWPMNQFRSGRIEAKGMEVASAYNALVGICTDKKRAFEFLGDQYGAAVIKTKWIFTTEEDNIIPPMAIQQLMQAVHTCPDCGREVGGHCAGSRAQCQNCKAWRCERGHKGYDAVSGLYSVKTDPAIPMVFGNPNKPDDFKPRKVSAAIAKGSIVEVNGLPMGCGIWRKAMFHQVSKPWFETTSFATQDIFFCKKAKKEAEARFAVHCGVKVGHLDVTSGEIV
jgi:hypothetical protein